MELDSKLSCDGFIPSGSTSSKSDVNIVCDERISKKNEKSKIPKHQPQAELEQQPSCSNMLTTSSSSSSSISNQYFNAECRLHSTQHREPPNIGYELAIAKSILQEYSTLSGDNLFDHLSDIIKRVIDERPPNVIDFFEEFSRNVREQKFHLPERFPPDAIYEESRMYRVAKKILLSMKLPYNDAHQDAPPVDEMSVEDVRSDQIDDLKIEITDNSKLFITFSGRVQLLEFYWDQCGFSISSDDTFQLACSMDRLQTHPSIVQSRFWGVINGLKASYYIVEASLTQEEVRCRIEQMEKEMRENNASDLNEDKQPKPLPAHIGPELTPGVYGWENYPEEELAKMQPIVQSVPLIEQPEIIEVPPESFGSGLNRYSYFVVNALSDEWIELPVVTPRQILVARQIKKFLTGDLEAEINSYPCFPGKEKHYLRAMIARITSGTYIAPEGYYRKMTKHEKRLYDGIEDDEMEEEEEEEEPMMGEDEQEEIDNDVMLLMNEKYEIQSAHSLASPAMWVHVRPNILHQGRVLWFDVEKARRDRDKERARLLKLRLAEEMGEEEEEELEEEEEVDGEEEDLLEGFEQPEIGPPILNPCHYDTTDESTIPWIGRLNSKHTNKVERILVMHSNVWPGAYTFIFNKLCDSIYLGWGHKYVARNMAFTHLPQIAEEYVHGEEDFIETIDPSVEEEEAYKLSLLKKQMQPIDDGAEQLDEFDDDDDNEGTPTE